MHVTVFVLNARNTSGSPLSISFVIPSHHQVSIVLPSHRTTIKSDLIPSLADWMPQKSSARGGLFLTIPRTTWSRPVFFLTARKVWKIRSQVIAPSSAYCECRERHKDGTKIPSPGCVGLAQAFHLVVPNLHGPASRESICLSTGTETEGEKRTIYCVDRTVYRNLRPSSCAVRT